MTSEQQLAALAALAADLYSQLTHAQARVRGLEQKLADLQRPETEMPT